MVTPNKKRSRLITVRRNASKRYGREIPDPDGPPGGSSPLLTLRAAFLLMAAGLAAAGAVVLTYLMDHSIPAALFAGFTAGGTVLSLLNGLIGP